MSELGHEETRRAGNAMSAVPPKTHVDGMRTDAVSVGFPDLIPKYCVRTRTTGPEPMTSRDLTTPHPRGLERTHSLMVLSASGQNQISTLATAMSALTPIISSSSYARNVPRGDIPWYDL